METEGGAPAFSPEWVACLLAEAEALLAERVSAAVRARWRREVKLPRMSLQGCLEQLSEARRGREALLARAGALSEAKQERLQTFLRLEMALLREMQALRERALASASAIAKKGETPPGPAREEAGGAGEAPRPPSPGKEEGAAAAAPVVSAAEAASQAKAAAQREALEEALWEPGGVGDLIAKSSDLQFALERFLGERLGETLRGLERTVREEGRARMRQLLGVRDALETEGWAERAEALRREVEALRGDAPGPAAALREKAEALRGCLQEAPVEELRPLLETAVALLEKTDSWWVAWLEKALWAGPLEEAEAAQKEADALRDALQAVPPEEAAAALRGALEAKGAALEEAAPRWGSLEEMRDALQSAPFDEVFALLKKPLALREALRNAPEPEEQGELLGVLAILEEAFCQVQPGSWKEKLRGLSCARWEEAAALLEKVWALKTEIYFLISDLDREEKLVALMGELRVLQEEVRGAHLADRGALREKLEALQRALQEIPVKEVLLLRHKAKALRKKATDFWTNPLDEADGLLEEVDALREGLRSSPLREALGEKVEDLRRGLREIAKKKISVLSYYLWNVLWSPLWKKVGDMQRALWKTPRKEEGAVQEKLGDLEHALDEILEDNLSGLPRILYALPGIVTALQKKVHAVRESLQETPPEMAVALQGKVVAMQEALWKIPFKEAHLMQEDLKAYCLALQKKVEAWLAHSPGGSAASKHGAALPAEEKADEGGEAHTAMETGTDRADPAGGRGRQGFPDLSASPGPANSSVGGGPDPGSARCFQYSVLKAIPHSHFQQRKDWYENTDQDLRDYVVQRLVHAIFPTPGLAVLKSRQIEKVVAYARKVEGDVYQSTNHWDVYCCLIMVKLFKIEKELREKRRFRLHKPGVKENHATSVEPPRPGVPLDSHLATPEVPLTPALDPQGVDQLNPLSIWNIQRSPAAEEPPAASPVNSTVQMDEVESDLMVPGSPPWTPHWQSGRRAPSSTFRSPSSPPHQFVPQNPFPASGGAVDADRVALGDPAMQAAVAQRQGPGSPLPSSAPPFQHQALRGLPGPRAGTAQEPLPLPPAEAPLQQPCPKSAPGPGPLVQPLIGPGDAVTHETLGKRRKLAEGGWRASPPAGPAPPDGPAPPSPVTLESLCRSLEDLRVSVLRNLGEVHRQVEALEKRMQLLERWRAEAEGQP